MHAPLSLHNPETQNQTAMNDFFSHELLQGYWWLLISVLGSLLVCLLFIQGGQSLLYTIARQERERALLVNLLGRKWELTFTTLVTFGGAFFASFPLFYATSFGGAYWLWMLILFCFVIQAVSYEFRTKPANVLGRRTFELFLFVNGVLGTFLLGAAVSMFFVGAPFTFDAMRFSRWHSAWHGLEVLGQLLPWMLGLSVLFLSRVLALLYFAGSVEDAQVVARARKRLGPEGGLFLLFFCAFLLLLCLRDGLAEDSVTGQVVQLPYRYLVTLVELPLLGVFLLLGVLLWLFGWVRALSGRSGGAFWLCFGGAFLAVLALLLAAGWNGNYYLPSVAEMQDSLSIRNSSASRYSLMAMSIVSLLIPFVASYIAWAWKSLSARKITPEELDNEPHAY